jgi:hypothetical protein
LISFRDVGTSHCASVPACVLCGTCYVTLDYKMAQIPWYLGVAPPVALHGLTSLLRCWPGLALCRNETRQQILKYNGCVFCFGIVSVIR